MSKNSRTDKEYSRVQKLTYENSKLKKQVSTLRKQLSRIDLDRYESVRKIVEDHFSEEDQDFSEQLLDNIKKDWKCRHCEEGTLEIIQYNKIDTTWYYRKCDQCPHRTRGKIYNKDTVKGIIKNTE